MMKLLMQRKIDVEIVKGDYDWPDEKYLLSEETIYLISKNDISLDNLSYFSMVNRKTPNVLLKYKDIAQIPFDKSIAQWWNEIFTVPFLIAM